MMFKMRPPRKANRNIRGRLSAAGAAAGAAAARSGERGSIETSMGRAERGRWPWGVGVQPGTHQGLRSEGA